jgi:16S rRNA (uracil1498-N3)-methyltransferase
VIVLEGDQANHLARVRRIGAGENVEVFDGKGFAASAIVVSVQRDRVELLPQGIPTREEPPRSPLTLACAVPKGERFDWLVEKAVELGVSRLTPIRTDRSVVDPREAKLERLRKTVVESSKQCGRNILMAIDEPVDFPTLLEREQASDNRLWIAHPGRGRLELGPEQNEKPIVFAIGPEGGFTVDEVERAERRGWAAVSLSRTVLRIETAALVAVARVLAQFERWGEPCR